MSTIDNTMTLDACLGERGITLTPLEKYSAWNIIRHEHNVLKMGKYFYIGMTAPAPIPQEWWEVDCHLLGFLTERKCRLLCQESKDFIERFILGEKYKQYRRSLQEG